MAMTFKKATKRQSKLRLSIAGPSGSGKTYTSLAIASAMGGRIAFIDTERGSAAKYSDRFEFDVLELDDFHPHNYVNAIREAEKAGYEIIIIDSTTHEWNGKNGILELHEAAVQKQRTKNSYTAWAEVTPLHNDFINGILQSKCHIIASVRSKTEYVQEKNDRGQTEIRKVGMASIQREGMDYEYDVMMEMNTDHTGVITKTRCAALDGRIFKKPSQEIADILSAWLSDGAPALAKPEAEEAVDPTESLIGEINSIWIEMGGTEATWNAYLAKHLDGKPVETIEKRLAEVRAKADKKRAEAEANATPDDLLAAIERECAAAIAAGAGQGDIDDAIAATASGICDLNQIEPELLPAVLAVLIELRAEAEAHTKAKA